MKTRLFAAVPFLPLLGCQPAHENAADTTLVTASAAEQHAHYTPGFGDLMTRIQLHHAKLYFAGQAQNWKLAAFSLHEIEEALEHIEKFCADRQEVKSLNMLAPAVDSVSSAIAKRNLSAFNDNYQALTQACNSCHQVTGYEYIKIVVPAAVPVTNQRFEAE